MIKKYEEPIIDIIEFGVVDIIRTSTEYGFDDEIDLV